MNKNITLKNLKKFSKNFNKNKTNKVFKNINTKGSLGNLLIKSDYIQKNKLFFKNKIKNVGKITDQHHSGRCWLFASLSVIRFKMIKKYNLDNFEFSQNYLFFYDKLEKCNYFINYIIKNKNTPLSDIKLITLLKNATHDGGNWTMFKNLINKYGIIPKSEMNDHYHSKSSKQLENFLNNYLRKSAKELRESKNININEIKEKIIETCYKILICFLGEPPSKISWEFYDKKNNYNKTIEKITPQEFYKKFVPYNVNNKVLLINYPCKKYYNLYNVDMTFRMDNNKENYINVPIEIMISVIEKSIKNNEAIYIGVDWHKYISQQHGFLDQNGFNYNDVFGFNNDMNKCDNLKYRSSSPNHAILIKGFNKKNKKYEFLIENSHGESSGKKGDYYMSEDWFRDYVYRINIDKKYVPNNVKNVLNKQPITLPFTDPFGSLLHNSF